MALSTRQLISQLTDARTALTHAMGALGVMTLDPRLHKLLEGNDPMALKQAERAMEAAKAFFALYTSQWWDAADSSDPTPPDSKYLPVAVYRKGDDRQGWELKLYHSHMTLYRWTSSPGLWTNRTVAAKYTDHLPAGFDPKATYPVPWGGGGQVPTTYGEEAARHLWELDAEALSNLGEANMAILRKLGFRVLSAGWRVL